MELPAGLKYSWYTFNTWHNCRYFDTSCQVWRPSLTDVIIRVWPEMQCSCYGERRIAGKKHPVMQNKWTLHCKPAHWHSPSVRGIAALQSVGSVPSQIHSSPDIMCSTFFIYKYTRHQNPASSAPWCKFTTSDDVFGSIPLNRNYFQLSLSVKFKSAQWKWHQNLKCVRLYLNSTPYQSTYMSQRLQWNYTFTSSLGKI